MGIKLDIPKELKGKKITPIIMDPIGYFLIKVSGKNISIAFCNYKKESGWYNNSIEKKYTAKSKEDILIWVKEHKLYSREDHFNYLVKELDKAEYAIKNKTKYVQE